MEKWINRLISEINETVLSIISKLNTLSSIKEDVNNKKTDLTSTSNTHYPSVPAVKVGLSGAVTESNTYTDTKISALDSKFIPKTEKGSINGVAELDNNGKIPSSQLPSYVDDVVDIKDFVTEKPTSGMTVGEKYYNITTSTLLIATSPTTTEEELLEPDKIYVKVSDSTVWRWSGTQLVQMNAGLVLGETSTTAYRGDRGKIAYDHSLSTGNPHNTQISQIPNLQSELDGKSPTSHTHAYATSTTPGFVELGSDTVQTVASESPTSVANRTYPIQLNSAGQMVVNVGWEGNNTTYQEGSAANLNATTPDGIARLWAPNVLKPWADGRYVLLDEMGDPKTSIPDWSAQLESQTNF